MSSHNHGPEEGITSPDSPVAGKLSPPLTSHQLNKQRINKETWWLSKMADNRAAASKSPPYPVASLTATPLLQPAKKQILFAPLWAAKSSAKDDDTEEGCLSRLSPYSGGKLPKRTGGDGSSPIPAGSQGDSAQDEARVGAVHEEKGAGGGMMEPRAAVGDIKQEEAGGDAGETSQMMEAEHNEGGVLEEVQVTGVENEDEVVVGEGRESSSSCQSKGGESEKEMLSEWTASQVIGGTDMTPMDNPHDIPQGEDQRKNQPEDKGQYADHQGLVRTTHAVHIDSERPPPAATRRIVEVDISDDDLHEEEEEELNAVGEEEDEDDHDAYADDIYYDEEVKDAVLDWDGEEVKEEAFHVPDMGFHHPFMQNPHLMYVHPLQQEPLNQAAIEDAPEEALPQEEEQEERLSGQPGVEEPAGFVATEPLPPASAVTTWMVQVTDPVLSLDRPGGGGGGGVMCFSPLLIGACGPIGQDGPCVLYKISLTGPSIPTTIIYRRYSELLEFHRKVCTH